MTKLLLLRHHTYTLSVIVIMHDEQMKNGYFDVMHQTNNAHSGFSVLFCLFDLHT